MERDFALSFLNQLGALAGVGQFGGAAGISPLSRSGHGPIVGSPGGGVGGVGSVSGAPMRAAAPLVATGGPTGAAGFSAGRSRAGRGCRWARRQGRRTA